MQYLKKKVEKRYNVARQKGEQNEKKCYYTSETNSSGLCIVAGVQWHHTNELTVVLSSKVQVLRKKKERKNTTEEGKKVKPKTEN